MLTKVKDFFSHKEQSGVELDPISAEWAQQCAMTPDNWKLEQYIRQLVFLPCDIKEGGKNFGLIEDFINGPIYDDAYTAAPYTFWKKDLGSHSFPIPLPADYRPDAYTVVPVEALPIKGSLYFIPGNHIKVLDNHRQNGLQFFRDRVSIRVPYRTVRYGSNQHGHHKPLPVVSNHNYFATVDAWMYFGIKEYWDPMIAGIFKSQTNTFEHDSPRVWIKKYYKFPDDAG